MELKDKVVELLSNSEAMGPGDIAAALGAEKKDLDKAIKELKAEERIISPKRCFYSVPK